MKQLLLDFARARTTPVELVYDTGRFPDLLRDRGYTTLTLVGLDWLGAKVLDGSRTGEFSISPDPDAQLMLGHYLGLEHMLATNRPAEKRLYLSDGYFEFSFRLSSESSALVRAGIYVATEGDWWANGIAVDRSAYLAAWRSIAYQMSQACSAPAKSDEPK